MACRLLHFTRAGRVRVASGQPIPPGVSVDTRRREGKRDMATKRSKRKAKPSSGALRDLRLSAARIRNEGERLVKRIRSDAERLISRGRGEVLRDVQQLRKDFRKRAESTIRGFERQIAKQLHAATEVEVNTLRRRVTTLERRTAELERRFGARAA
jgi:hypothetical protein